MFVKLEEDERREAEGKKYERKNMLPSNVKKRFEKVMFDLFYGPIHTFDQLSTADQERYVERYSITVCVGVSCVLSSFFYWFLPPLWRVFLVPSFIGGAWWVGAKLPKLLNEDARKQSIQRLNVVEFYQLIEAVKFSAVSFCFALIPFVMNRELLEHSMESPEIRTLYLCLFTWNLIGAPLFAQAKTALARLLIMLVFGVPAATVTIWWGLFWQ